MYYINIHETRQTSCHIMPTCNAKTHKLYLYNLVRSTFARFGKYDICQNHLIHKLPLEKDKISNKEFNKRYKE